MRNEAHHQQESSAPSAIALLWLMLRQVIALAFAGATGSASNLLDKLERDLKRHILIEARKLAELERACCEDREDNRGDYERGTDNDLNRIACINGRFVQIPVTEAETRDPAIRRAAILGQAQFARFLRAARLARRITGAGHAWVTRRFKTFLRSIVDAGHAFARSTSDTQQLADARIRAPP